VRTIFKHGVSSAKVFRSISGENCVYGSVSGENTEWIGFWSE
jgi:hypothetical protein